MLAMSAARNGEPDKAIDWLLDHNFLFDDVGMPSGSSTTMCLMRVENFRGGLRSFARWFDSLIQGRRHHEAACRGGPWREDTYLQHPPIYPQLPRRDVLLHLKIRLGGIALDALALPGLSRDNVAQEYPGRPHRLFAAARARASSLTSRCRASWVIGTAPRA